LPVHDGVQHAPSVRLALTVRFGSMSPDNVEQALGHAATPAVRLAYNPGPIDAYGALAPAPTVRLALAHGQAERNGHGGLEAPSVRIALGAQVCHTVQGLEHSARAAPVAPALLVSYVYLAPFRQHRARYAFRDWVLDSGAFSAHQVGTPIDLGAYIATCQELLATDPQLTEVFALDVIGDWRGTVRNTEAMWAAGVPAIPAFHVGAPWELLRDLAQQYPKIALGNAVGYRAKLPWAAQCFARIKRDLGRLVPIHGFGFGTAEQVLALPWHSVDATNWEIGPCKFGRWNSFGQLSVRGSQQNLRAEVEWYLRLEAKARVRWRAEMAALATAGPSVRPACNGAGEGEVNGALGAPPTVRLALAGPHLSERAIANLGPGPAGPG
jgi:hypothetical protein